MATVKVSELLKSHGTLFTPGMGPKQFLDAWNGVPASVKNVILGAVPGLGVSISLLSTAFSQLQNAREAFVEAKQLADAGKQTFESVKSSVFTAADAAAGGSSGYTAASAAQTALESAQQLQKAAESSANSAMSSALGSVQNQILNLEITIPGP